MPVTQVEPANLDITRSTLCILDILPTKNFLISVKLSYIWLIGQLDYNFRRKKELLQWWTWHKQLTTIIINKFEQHIGKMLLGEYFYWNRQKQGRIFTMIDRMKQEFSRETLKICPEIFYIHMKYLTALLMLKPGDIVYASSHQPHVWVVHMSERCLKHRRMHNEWIADGLERLACEQDGNRKISL